MAAFRVTFKYLVEIVDHDGYCSGEDCEYESKIETVTVSIPAGEDAENIEKLSKSELVKYLPLIPTTIWKGGRQVDLENMPSARQSGYCRLQGQAKKSGIARHDYRITILKL